MTTKAQIEAATDTRPEVQSFARLMEQKLQMNDHKRHWTNYSRKWLQNRLRQEVEELCRADPSNVPNEAADVANFAMMIADVVGRQRP